MLEVMLRGTSEVVLDERSSHAGENGGRPACCARMEDDEAMHPSGPSLMWRPKTIDRAGSPAVTLPSAAFPLPPELPSISPLLSWLESHLAVEDVLPAIRSHDPAAKGSRRENIAGAGGVASAHVPRSWKVGDPGAQSDNPTPT